MSENLVTPSCVRCRFACTFLSANSITRSYVCKRVPPIPVVVGIDPHRGPAVTAQHPIVTEKQWCFEFQEGEPTAI